MITSTRKSELRPANKSAADEPFRVDYSRPVSKSTIPHSRKKLERSHPDGLTVQRTVAQLLREHEIDLLAIKPGAKGKYICRHIEVSVSTNPIAYISKVPKAIQKRDGIGPDCAKTRSEDEIRIGIQEWVDKKFNHSKKVKLRNVLCPGGVWSKELVVNVVKHDEEVGLFEDTGVKIIRFADIIKEMQNSKSVINAASGDDLLNLIMLGKSVNAKPED